MDLTHVVILLRTRVILICEQEIKYCQFYLSYFATCAKKIKIFFFDLLEHLIELFIASSAVPKTYLNSPLGPFYPQKLRFNLSAIGTLSGSLPVPIKTVETAAVEGKMELKSRLLPIYGHANCGIHSR